MKKKLWLTAILLSVVVIAAFLILYACTPKEELKEPKTKEVGNTLSETEETETSPAAEEEPEEKEIYEKSERKKEFEELIKENPLDLAYREDASDETLETSALLEKYTELWQEELHFSCEFYAACLTAIDRERFLYYEEKWEKATLDEFKLYESIYSGTVYELDSDSPESAERDADYMMTLRERTLYVKYLQFSLESASGEEAEIVFLYGSPTPPPIVNKFEEPESTKDEEDPKKEENDKKAEEDAEIDEKADESEAKNTIITNQKDPAIKNVKVGSGNVGENGCGVVAIHNVKVLKGVESTLSETIRDVQNKYGLIVDGYLGVNPLVVDEVLKGYGINCTSVKAKDLTSPGLYLIAFWNNPKDLSDGAHYVVLQVYEDSFEVINGDQNGPKWYSDKYIYGYRIN